MHIVYKLGNYLYIAWWSSFTQEQNGVALFPDLPTGATIVSDASGTWGCGAYNTITHQWFQLQWPASWSGVNIAVKELIPVVVSAAIWGQDWSGSRVLFRTDNQAVVSRLSSRAARNPHLAHLLRCLFFFETQFRFEHQTKHIAGCANTAADALSRNRLADFFSLVPQAPQTSQPVPSALAELLWDRMINWTSARWTVLFKSILRTVSPGRQ